MDPVTQFLEITQTNSRDLAEYYLEVSNGNLQAAIEMVFEDGGGNTTSQSVTQDTLTVLEDGGGNTTSQSVTLDTSTMSILEWNIQGLLDDYLRERTVGIVDIINANKPSAIMLQEVVVSTYLYLKSKLKNNYVGYSPYELRPGSCPGYFTAIFVLKPAFTSCSAKVNLFNGSQQGRDILLVNGKCHGRDVTLMTSHLESTKTGEEERKRQLVQLYDMMIHPPSSHTVVFGGDTNLRDHEVNAVVKEGKFDLTRVNDIWNMLGSPADSRFSWDLQKNDNQIKDGKARLRFERMYMRVGNGEQYKPKEMKFVGTERLPCGLFPSDHWGIMTTFKI